MSSYSSFPRHAWDSVFQKLIDAETYYISQNWSRFVSLAPPPPDSAGECAAVRKAGEDRAEREDEILEQAKSLELQLWPIIAALNIPNVAKATWKIEVPYVWELLRAALWDMQGGLYILKHRFNRGRPIHTCGSRVGVTTVPTPGHPSYPGGHAAQCHAAVLLLEAVIKLMKPIVSNQSELVKAMLEAAERVTENRVVAGIHFPSDSFAGKQLALQYVPMLLQSELFLDLVGFAAEKLTLKVAEESQSLQRRAKRKARR